MRYVLGPQQSRFTIQAFAKGMLAPLGPSPTFEVCSFSGELACPPTFRLCVRADSLRLTDAVSLADREMIETRMRREVLDAATHPEIAYQSDAIEAESLADNAQRLHIDGRLTLRGESTAVPIVAVLRLTDDHARLAGEFTIRMSDFGIGRVSALGGLISLQDELRAAFELVGRKTSEIEAAVAAAPGDACGG